MDGSFKILKTLGAGGQGTTFSVQRISDGDVFAAKKLECSSIAEANRALREAKTLQKLGNHPLVVSYEDVVLEETDSGGEHLVTVTILMEFCDRGDLASLLESCRSSSQPLPQTVVVRWMSELCAALVFLHGESVLHRDIKPPNIFIASRGGGIKLGDFGLACVHQQKFSGGMGKAGITTGPGGTPCYLSPEVLSRNEYGPASDVWSAGCCALEMMSLAFLWERRGLLGMQIMSEGCPPVAMDDMMPQYSPKVRAFACKMMRREAGMRPPPSECEVFFSQAHKRRSTGVEAAKQAALKASEQISRRGGALQQPASPGGGGGGGSPVVILADGLSAALEALEGRKSRDRAPASPLQRRRSPGGGTGGVLPRPDLAVPASPAPNNEDEPGVGRVSQDGEGGGRRREDGKGGGRNVIFGHFAQGSGGTADEAKHGGAGQQQRCQHQPQHGEAGRAIGANHLPLHGQIQQSVPGGAHAWQHRHREAPRVSTDGNRGSSDGRGQLAAPNAFPKAEPVSAGVRPVTAVTSSIEPPPRSCGRGGPQPDVNEEQQPASLSAEKRGERGAAQARGVAMLADAASREAREAAGGGGDDGEQAGTKLRGRFTGQVWVGVVEKDGERYSGNTARAGGMYDGLGVLCLSDGTVYRGQFVDGRYNGKGVLSFAGGDEYSGGFSAGSFHGYGSYRKQADGTTLSGVFNRGRCTLR